MGTRPTLKDRRRGRWLLAAAILAVVSAELPVTPTRAQTPGTPYSLRMSRDAAKQAITAWNDRLPYVPGQVLVKFRAGTGIAARSRTLSALRGPLDGVESTWIGEVLLARTTAEPDAEAAAAALARQPDVEWAQPNYLRRLHATPNDPSYPRQWNFDLVGMPRAWDINPGGNSTIVVAVIDTGVTTTSASYPFPIWTERGFETVEVPVAVNPDIAAARIDAGRDFVFWDGPVLDLVGHGTHVAGTALQETNNGLGLSGIAYQARLMPLKACFGYWELQITQSARGIPGFVDPREDGGCPDSAVAEAIRFAADNHAHVINLSLGSPSPSPVTRDALAYAVGRGSFVAISVGNQFERGNAVEYPAAYAPEFSGVVSVGAVSRSGRKAAYSSTGAHLELAAPGGDFRDGSLAGMIYQIGLQSADADPATIIRPRFDRYVEQPMQGTSMATPHVSGIAALLFSQGISSPAAVETGMRQLARDLGPSGRDEEYGDGLIDARAALRGLGLAR